MDRLTLQSATYHAVHDRASLWIFDDRARATPNFSKERRTQTNLFVFVILNRVNSRSARSLNHITTDREFLSELVLTCIGTPRR